MKVSLGYKQGIFTQLTVLHKFDNKDRMSLVMSLSNISLGSERARLSSCFQDKNPTLRMAFIFVLYHTYITQKVRIFVSINSTKHLENFKTSLTFFV